MSVSSDGRAFILDLWGKIHGPRRSSFSKDGCYHRESGEVLLSEAAFELDDAL